MSKVMQAVEMTGMVDENKQVRLDGPVPVLGLRKVRGAGARPGGRSVAKGNRHERGICLSA